MGKQLKIIIILLVLVLIASLWSKLVAQSREDWNICGTSNTVKDSNLCYNRIWDIPFDEWEAQADNYIVSKFDVVESEHDIRCISYTDSRNVLVQLCNEPGENKIVLRKDVYDNRKDWELTANDIANAWEYDSTRNSYWLYKVVEVQWSDQNGKYEIYFVNHMNMINGEKLQN